MIPTKCGQSGKPNFLQIVDKHAPIRTKRVKSKSCPWITADLKERMHNRDTLKIKAIKSNDPHDWANFKRMRNKVNTEIKTAKKVFYNNKFIENNGDLVKHGKPSTILLFVRRSIHRLGK